MSYDVVTNFEKRAKVSNGQEPDAQRSPKQTKKDTYNAKLVKLKPCGCNGPCHCWSPA